MHNYWLQKADLSSEISEKIYRIGMAVTGTVDLVDLSMHLELPQMTFAETCKPEDMDETVFYLKCCPRNIFFFFFIFHFVGDV